MQINNPAAPTQAVAAPVATPVAVKPTVLFTVIGAAWKRIIKGNEFLTISIGNTREGINQVTFNAGDKIFLRHNTKRPNMPKDPDFQVCVQPV